jgi:putative membrane protein
MSPGAKAFLQRWFVTTLGVLVAAGLISGVQAEGMVPLLTASLILGVLNAFIRPALLLIALPLVIVTLGLFTFVINALLLYFVAWIVNGFHVASFGSALLGAIVISIVSVFANMIFGKPQPPPRKDRPRPNSPQRPPPPPDTGSGPVIDV